MNGPCEWPVSYAGCSDCSVLDDLPAEEKAIWEQVAVEYLWRWTKGQFGLCSVTVRPCRQDCQPSTFWGGDMARTSLPTTGGPWTPALLNGKWYNLGCTCGVECSCSVVHQISLPAPVAQVESVVVDGVVLDSADWRVDNRKYLVRLDGEGWPICNDMSAPSASGIGEVGTWEVTYKRGAEVPTGGQVAAGILAGEFAKAACGQDCALPKRVQSVTRQGVTFGMLDTFEDIDVGHTGIWLVDSWVASVTKPKMPSRVLSPDIRAPRRTTQQ